MATKTKKAAEKADKQDRDYAAEAHNAHMALAEIRKLAVEKVKVTPTEVIDAIARNNVNTEDFETLASGV